MRLPLTLKNFRKVRHSSREVRRGRVWTSISSIIFVTVIFSLSKDVACVSSDPNHGSLQTYYGLLSSLSVFPLVISLSVIINPQSSWARNIKNGQEQPSSSPRIFPSILGISLFQKSVEEAAAKEETKPKGTGKRKKLPARFARQLSVLAPALQTMGCLPKFFCGMSSKAPSETTSTLNDMAYLIRFAMVDDDSEENSGENKGKDGMSSDEGSREKTSQERRQDQRFEYQAEEELVMDDPEYLSYMWKDMKEKLKNKFKDGKIDDEVFEQMMADWDKENKGSFQLPTSLLSGIGSIGSGIKSLVRFGRSVSSDESSSSASRHGRAFWDTKEFDQQMTLAARIGKTSGNDDKKCTTAFNLCPYTMEQMKGMVSGKVPHTNGYENFYDNTKGPPRPTGKDSKEDEDEFVPVKPKPFKIVKKPNNQVAQAVYQFNPNSAWGRRPPSPKRPHSSVAATTLASILRPLKQETEDDEVAYDNHALDYAAETKLIKLSEVMNLPKKTAYKTKKNKKKPSKAKDELEDVLDSSEEEKEAKPLKKKRPLIPVGIPRPKYKVNKNKIIDLPTKKKPTKPIKVRDEEEEEDEEPSQEDEKASPEEEEESGEKRAPPTKRKKPAGSPEQSGESEEKEEEEKKSSEEANSSEEGGRRKNGGGRPGGNKGGAGGGWEEYEFSGEVTPGPHVSLRPISYSYFKNKPPPTSALPPSPDGPEDEVSYSSAPPPPPPSQNPGFFGSLFGMGKKRPQQQPMPSQMPPQEMQYEEMVRDEDEGDEEDSRSQEDYHSNIHGTPDGPPPPPFSPEPSEGPPRPHSPPPGEGPQGSPGPHNHRPPPNNQNRPSSQLSQYNRRPPPPPQNHRPRPPQNSRPPPTQNSRPPPPQNSRPPPTQNSRPPPTQNSRPPPTQNNRPPPTQNSRPHRPQNSQEISRPHSPPPPNHRNPPNGPPHSHSNNNGGRPGRPDHRPHFSNEISHNRPHFSNEVSHNRPPPKHSNHPSNRPLPPPPQHNNGPHFLPPFRPGPLHDEQNDEFDDRRPSPGIPPPATPGHPDHPDSRIPDDDNDFRPPPQERREPPSSNSQPNNNNKKDSDEESKEEEEEEDLTSVSEESKESEEVAKDKIRVKEIFSKGSIASLGSDKVISPQEEEEYHEYIPPPPPIAHWQPPEISTTTAVVNPTQPVPTELLSSSRRPPTSVELGSVEVHVLSSDEDDSRENKESDEEKSSEEEVRKNQVYLPEGGRFKPEDDEADNPEPPKENLNDVRVAELGNVVKTPPVSNVGSDDAPNYYPPLAPASAFLDPKKEIKIPMTKPSVGTPACVPTRRRPCPKESSTNLVDNGGDNKNDAAEGTNNANAQGGAPGGGLPGNVPGTGALNRAPGGGRPGGATNNRGQSGGNGNNNSGNGANGNGNENSSQENNSSEEEIGEKSSEESENETEEEEEDYDEEENSKRGRKASTKIKLKLKKPILAAKTKTNSTEVPPTTTAASETPEKKKSELDKLGIPKAPPLPPVFRWGNHPVVSYPKKNNKPRLTSPVSTKKPVIRRIVRPRPTKDTFYSKPLSPKLVQYLRETYGGVVKIPDRVRDIKSPPTTTPAPKKASRKEVEERSTKKPMKYSWRHSFEDEDEISQVGKRSSEEIDFDEMKSENEGVGFKIAMLGKRQGEPETDKKSSQTNKDTIAETTLPPIYGQNHFKKG